MRMPRRSLRPALASALLAFGLAACSAQPVADLAQEARELQAMPSCCASLQALTTEAKTLPASGEADYVIGPASPAFDFPGGKSPLLALALPPADAQRRIAIASRGRPGPSETEAVFLPLVILLDGQGRALRETAAEDIAIAGGASRVSLAYGGPGDPARFAVLHTSAALVETTRRGFDRRFMFSPTSSAGFRYLLLDRPIAARGSYFGRLSVRVSD